MCSMLVPGAADLGVGPQAVAALSLIDAGQLDAGAALSLIAGWDAQISWISACRAAAIRRLAVLTPEPPPEPNRSAACGSDSDGHHWEREELMLACRIGPAEAMRRMRCARALPEMLAATADRLAAGKLSWEHAVALADETAALQPAQARRVEATVLGDARLLTPWQYRTRARRLAAAMRPELPVLDAEDVHMLRSVRTWTTRDGIGALFAQLPHDDLATVAAAIDQLASAGDVRDGRSTEQRRADGLVDLCGHYLDGSVHSVHQHIRPSAHLNVHVPLDTLLAAGTLTPTSDVATLHAPGIGGPQMLDTRTLARLACDASIRRLVTDPLTGLIVREDRIRRVASPAVRRAVEHRDGYRCTFPGCDRATHLDLHHIRPWMRGGRTEPENLTTVCRRHHHAVHQAGWRVRRRFDGLLTWLSPTGQLHPPCVERQPAGKSPSVRLLPAPVVPVRPARRATTPARAPTGTDPPF